MAKIGILKEGDTFKAYFHCPGCDGSHAVVVRHPQGSHCWGYNENENKPTFTPSILVNSTDFTEKGERDYQAWADAGYPNPAPEYFETKPSVCHSFVTDGRIQFLDDCTHELKGQTVDLPDWEV